MIKQEAWDEAFTVKYDWVSPDQEPKKIDKYYKISIVTNCMNRLGDIKQTYQKNIEDSLSYKNLEFVLLNYGSKDSLDDYVKSDLMKYIENGVLNYYKTTEPEYYSMCHSRNITLKVAQGDIICSVDGDHFINKGFPSRINMMANMFPEKAVFCKSRQKNRGRLCFRKKEFIDLLGGYNEDFLEYGVDDHDLLCRAYKLGFKVVKFGSDHMTLTEDHVRHKNTNYKMHWKYTQRRNTLISLLNLKCGLYKANKGEHWGKAHLLKNFEEEMDI